MWYERAGEGRLLDHLENLDGGDCLAQYKTPRLFSQVCVGPFGVFMKLDFNNIARYIAFVELVSKVTMF